jgi:hypothetical protein
VYKSIASGQRQVEGTFVPAWLEALARSASSVGKTTILLEVPPFDPAFLELDEVDSTIAEDMDAILNNSLRRLRPLFKAGTVARQCGWVLDGCDLRYRYVHDGTHFVAGDAGLRHSIHKDLDGFDDLGNWEPAGGVVNAYYAYLTGLSDDRTGFDVLVAQLIAAVGNRNGPRRQSVFSQGAAYCRTLYADIPADVRRAACAFFAAKVPAAAELVRKDNEECFMNEPVTKGVVKYGIAEQLMNLALIGYILSDGAEMHNIVVVAGDDHLKVMREFLEDMRHSAFVASTCWSATPEKPTEELGFFCDLPKPIDVT